MVRRRICHGPPAVPPTSVSIALRCSASARSSMTRMPSPLPSWMAPGQFTSREKCRPSRGVLPNEPCSTRQLQPPSHLPVVGSALKLHGQPYAQLHETMTYPLMRHAGSPAARGALVVCVVVDAAVIVTPPTYALAAWMPAWVQRESRTCGPAAARGASSVVEMGRPDSIQPSVPSATLLTSAIP